VEVAGSSLVPNEAAHHAAVDAALASIAAGHLEKVVLARRRQLRLRGASTDLPLALWRAAPRSSADEVAFLIDVVGDAFVGVTPERLCRRRGRQLLVDVLAGTASPETTGLLDDDKERREHEAVRRFVHEALRPVTRHVESPEAPVLVRLRQLQHLYTPVFAELVDDAPVFARLHPTPAVAGMPQAPALACIAELEGFSRGLYAGVVGVIDASGEDLRVALRCAQVRADDDGADVFFYVGSGIVRGSDPASEWRELDRKEQTMATALGAIVAPVSMRSAHVLA
jgi:isochorismate synthase